MINARLPVARFREQIGSGKLKLEGTPFKLMSPNQTKIIFAQLRIPRCFLARVGTACYSCTLLASYSEAKGATTGCLRQDIWRSSSADGTP